VKATAIFENLAAYQTMIRTRIPPPIEAASLIGAKMEDYRWRATERKLGSIKGIRKQLVIIASDGNRFVGSLPV
jgi:hypothetical protein